MNGLGNFKVTYNAADITAFTTPASAARMMREVERAMRCPQFEVTIYLSVPKRCERSRCKPAVAQRAAPAERWGHRRFRGNG